jgi:hypothetical protein
VENYLKNFCRDSLEERFTSIPFSGMLIPRRDPPPPWVFSEIIDLEKISRKILEAQQVAGKILF